MRRTEKSVLLFIYVTFSSSGLARCATKVIPKKLPTRYKQGVQAYCQAKGGEKLSSG